MDNPNNLSRATSAETPYSSFDIGSSSSTPGWYDPRYTKEEEDMRSIESVKFLRGSDAVTSSWGNTQKDDIVVFKREGKLYSIPSREVELKSPIPFIYIHSGDEVLASLPELGIYGEGRSETEAYEDLQNEFVDLMGIIDSNSESSLGERPTGWKKTLQFMVKKCR